nr:MAG TPA: hypothetical protein [Caudoviricetes sp.]
MRNKTCSKGKFLPYNEVTAQACEDARNGKIGLSIAIVCEVLATPLRDRYMASRGIKAQL